jgi:preprotein translocase subunit SecA
MNAAPDPRREVPKAPPVESAAHPLTLDAEPKEVTIATRQASTTIDALEKEFHRKKQRDLEAASQAGSGQTPVEQRRVGEKVGRNDPCPCGSGKKYKKCHGAGK